jgi:excisionase family DNA binding protein
MHPDDLAALATLIADELADRALAELAHITAVILPENVQSASGRLLTAAEVAQQLGLSRDSVYRRAGELGALRIGRGAKPRLRFDSEKVAAALDACSAGKQSPALDPPPSRRSRRRRTSNIGPASPLLPVRGL